MFTHVHLPKTLQVYAINVSLLLKIKRDQIYGTDMSMYILFCSYYVVWIPVNLINLNSLSS